MPSNYFAAWWNLENLFDIEGSPRRTEKVKRAIGEDIVGWSQARLDRKVSQLAAVIAQMNGGAGPDLLGVCEVENAFVLDLLIARLAVLLPGRPYEKVHADTLDQRGIDVAFLFDSRFFSVPAGEVFQHVVMRRTATREILQVNFKTHRDRTLTAFANHWPSRSGGHYESDGYRAIAGETLSYFHERAIEVHGEATPVIALGDFNDEPFDESLVRHALSTRQRALVVNGTSPRLLNLGWDIIGAGDGTFFFENQANVLDQVLVNKNLLKQNSPIRVEAGSVAVFRAPGHAASGTYPRPIPFGGMGKPVNENGFSDHFPITVRLIERD